MPEPDAITWAWNGARNVSLDVARVDALPEDGDDIPDPEYVITKKAANERQYTTEGLTVTQFEALEEQIGSVITFSDQNGRSVTGLMTSLSGTEVPGNRFHDQVQMTVRIV